MPADGSPLRATDPSGRTRTTPSTYLIFTLRRSLYGVEAVAVREILALPALTPFDEAPPEVIGMLNLRGSLVPVFDLDRSLGREPEPYRLTDHLVVLQSEGRLCGMVVHDVRGVRAIDPEAIEELPGYRLDARASRLAGIAKIDEGLVMLLRLDRLLALPGIEPDACETEPIGELASWTLLRPGESGQGQIHGDGALFQERARMLARPVQMEDVGDLRPLAVVRLGEEPFGIDLAGVREFGPLRHVTPVPCCPRHVVGQMNLRGDILTLVDIRDVIGLGATSAAVAQTLSPTHTLMGGGAASVVVVQAGTLLCGVLVDEVLDVVYLRPDEIIEVPVAVRALAHEFVTGTAPFGGRLLTLLDLPRLLAREDLVVNEEP
jgi:purine-binding chemotaxis protein CheW